MLLKVGLFVLLSLAAIKAEQDAEKSEELIVSEGYRSYSYYPRGDRDPRKFFEDVFDDPDRYHGFGHSRWGRSRWNRHPSYHSRSYGGYRRPYSDWRDRDYYRPHYSSHRDHYRHRDWVPPPPSPFRRHYRYRDSPGDRWGHRGYRPHWHRGYDRPTYNERKTSAHGESKGFGLEKVVDGGDSFGHTKEVGWVKTFDTSSSGKKISGKWVDDLKHSFDDIFKEI
ncbi:uncharacterized protein [Centruroides vittatus]|uniref:uncharacterized protein n=1 Tax=Centruroides vittatus TaxID=120091 RepID=UPI0035102488